MNSLEEVKSYLLSEDTCKCGLPCPFHIDKVFKFDPSVESQIWRLSDIKAQSLSSQTSCCHKKHIQSNALANDCMALIKSAKPIPARRKGKPILNDSKAINNTIDNNYNLSAFYQAQPFFCNVVLAQDASSLLFYEWFFELEIMIKYRVDSYPTHFEY